VPEGWDLDDIACVGDDDPVIKTPTSATVTLDAGENIVCTFTNGLPPTNPITTVTLEKVADTDETFNLSIDGPGSDNDAAGVRGDGGLVEVIGAAAGLYTVSETSGTGDPADYDATLICTDSVPGDVVAQTAVTSATFTLEPEQTVVCTFTNTHQKGKIIVQKQTLPDGDPTLFTFTGDVEGMLSDGQTAMADVDPGQYTSTETVPEGWDLTEISCNDGDSTGAPGTATATFNVDAGETVRCTFTNTLIIPCPVEFEIAPLPGTTLNRSFPDATLNVPYLATLSLEPRSADKTLPERCRWELDQHDFLEILSPEGAEEEEGVACNLMVEVGGTPTTLAPDGSPISVTVYDPTDATCPSPLAALPDGSSVAVMASELTMVKTIQFGKATVGGDEGDKSTPQDGVTTPLATDAATRTTEVDLIVPLTAFDSTHLLVVECVCVVGQDEAFQIDSVSGCSEDSMAPCEALPIAPPELSCPRPPTDPHSCLVLQMPGPHDLVNVNVKFNPQSLGLAKADLQIVANTDRDADPPSIKLQGVGAVGGLTIVGPGTEAVSVKAVDIPEVRVQLDRSYPEKLETQLTVSFSPDETIFPERYPSESESERLDVVICNLPDAEIGRPYSGRVGATCVGENYSLEKLEIEERLFDAGLGGLTDCTPTGETPIQIREVCGTPTREPDVSLPLTVPVTVTVTADSKTYEQTCHILIKPSAKHLQPPGVQPDPPFPPACNPPEDVDLGPRPSCRENVFVDTGCPVSGWHNNFAEEPQSDGISKPTSEPIKFQTGTVAGTFRFDATVRLENGVDVSPPPPATQQEKEERTLDPSEPVIWGVDIKKEAASFTIFVTGFSTPRTITNVEFFFRAVSGADLFDDGINTADLVGRLGQWHAKSESVEFGSQFKVPAVFQVEGRMSLIETVGVKLWNEQGPSAKMWCHDFQTNKEHPDPSACSAQN
jgi:hypothetical protein